MSHHGDYDGSDNPPTLKPSKEKTRFTGGFPPQSVPGQLERTGSSPAWTDRGAAVHNDYYRNSMPQYRKDGQLDSEKMMPSAPFRKQYEHSKKLDKEAKQSQSLAKAYHATADIKTARERMRNPKNSERFGGNPRESET